MSDIWTLIDPRPCQWRGCGRPQHSNGAHDQAPHWHSDDSHPPTDDCHSYTPPKEESMRIATANVVVTQVARERRGTRVAVEWPKDGHNPPEPGDRLVVGWSFDAVLGAMLSSGPSPEEEAVIREAVRWYDRMVAMYGPEYVVEDPKTWVHDLAVAVKAMKGGR